MVLAIKTKRFQELDWEKEVPWALPHGFHGHDPESCLVLLMEADREFVSYLVYEELKHIEDRVDLHYVHTREEHQGKGYASRLVEVLKETAGARFAIWALHTNQLSQELLTKWGFQFCGQSGWCFQSTRTNN